MRAFIVSMLVLFFSCQQEKEIKTTNLSGKIINPVGNIVSLRVSGQDYVDTLNEQSQFNLNFDLNEPSEARFRHGNEITLLYLRPGDDLTLSLDTEAFDETLTYSGRGSEINQYYAAMILMGDSLPQTSELFEMQPDQFLSIVDSISRVKLSYLDQYGIDDQDFLTYKLNSEKWEVVSQKMQYADYAENSPDSISIPGDYYAFMEDLGINDTSNLKYPAFKDYLNSLIGKEAGPWASSEKHPGSYFYRFFQTTDELIENQTIKGELLYEILSLRYAYLKEDERPAVVGTWKNTQPSKEELTEVNDIINKWERLESGKPAPSFTYKSIDGDEVSLEDFRGNLVYIDVWATWCRPCIAEHPAMEELQERFKNKDVVFIAVSIDPEPEQWRKMVNNKELGGIHLYAPGEYQSVINQDYLIRGIPRFILIDHEGRIIDANADRPSMGIGDQIEKLLQEINQPNILARS